MNDIDIQAFERAIRAVHGGNPRFVDRVRVEENFQGERVWDGEVLVFELLDHPSARRCYAWEVDGEVTAVLEEGPVHCAKDAVQAAIAGS